MKLISLLLLVVIVTSCKEEEIQSFDSLTPEEQDAIRNMSYQRCVSEFSQTYQNFKDDSSGVFTSTTYERGYSWKFEYKLSSTVLRTMDVRVWRQAPNETPAAIYFHVTDRPQGGTGDVDYFLKITQTQNEAMIDQLLQDHCRKPAVMTITSSSDGPANASYQFTTTSTSRYTDNYILYFTHLAFFANYNFSRKYEILDSEGNVTSTSNYTSTFTPQGVYAFPTTDYENTTHYPSQKYCTVALNGDGLYRFEDSGTIGYIINTSDAAQCASSIPGTWSLTI